MLKLTIQTDCGNAPKREFLKDFRIALAKKDEAFILESVTDDIVWEIIGDKKIEGRNDFTTAIKSFSKAKELTLTQILSHGKEGSLCGSFIDEDGKKYQLAEFYIFKGAKGDRIKKITTYLI